MSPSKNHDKMAEMVKLIAQRGPRIDEIARVIGVYKETARYWYNQMIKNGFTVQASCNYEKLGMKRVICLVELEESFREYADSVFYVMGQLAFVSGFAKTQPRGSHILSASIPQECADSWTEFMRELEAKGVFRSVEMVTLDWIRNPPMWAEYFNFESGTWEFDWNNKQVNPEAMQVEASTKERYDGTDLKIIEQLQLDANTSLTDMVGKVGGINYKTLAWHYRAHVVGEGLVKGYRINWTGTRYDFSAERPVHKKHRNMWVDLLADGVMDTERLRLMGTLNRTPFVWVEGSGLNSYYARMVFSAEETPEALELLEDAVTPIRDKVKWFHLDQSHSLSFTLPNKHYDESARLWRFPIGELLSNFEALIMKVRQQES